MKNLDECIAPKVPIAKCLKQYLNGIVVGLLANTKSRFNGLLWVLTSTLSAHVMMQYEDT